LATDGRHAWIATLRTLIAGLPIQCILLDLSAIDCNHSTWSVTPRTAVAEREKIIKRVLLNYFRIPKVIYSKNRMVKEQNWFNKLHIIF